VDSEPRIPYNTNCPETQKGETAMSHYAHLTIEEREKLLKCIAEGKAIRETAREMKRSAST